MNKYSGFFLSLLVSIFIKTSAQELPPETPWSNPHQVHNHMDLPEPGYLETVHDSAFGVDITLISDEDTFGKSGAAIQHQYSKVQAWNADMTMISLGFTTLLDANDYSLMGTLDIGISMKDGRWSNVDPHIRYFGDGDFLKKVNVITKEVTTLHEFPGYGTCGIGPWEGNISADDKYVVVTSADEKNASVYDIENDTVLGTNHFPQTADWASVTPWGDYVVVSDRGTGDTRLYDLNFNFVRKLSDRQAHADFAIDAEGNRVLVEMCPIGMVRLDNGESTDLLPATEHTGGICRDNQSNPWICGHVSGRNFSMPGWVLISGGPDKCNNFFEGFYCRTEVFLLKLDGSGTIRHLGFTRSSYHNYLAEAKAVVSPDGTKAIFTSDWDYDGPGGNSRDYVVEFQPAGSHSLSTSVSGAGKIELEPDSVKYPEGTLIKATAIPDENSIFSGWSRYASGTHRTAYLRLGKDENLTANFKSLYRLTVTVEGEGTVSPSGGQYLEGSSKTLTATAGEGYMFAGWSGDTASTENPLTISMDSNINVTASFESTTSIAEILPDEIDFQANPNPFSNTTTIHYNLKKTTIVRLSVYDLSGREISILINEKQAAGEKDINWRGIDASGKEAPKGTYLLHLKMDSKAVMHKILLKL